MKVKTLLITSVICATLPLSAQAYSGNPMNFNQVTGSLVSDVMDGGKCGLISHYPKTYKCTHDNGDYALATDAESGDVNLVFRGKDFARLRGEALRFLKIYHEEAYRFFKKEQKISYEIGNKTLLYPLAGYHLSRSSKFYSYELVEGGKYLEIKNVTVKRPAVLPKGYSASTPTKEL